MVTAKYNASVRDRCSWLKVPDPWTDIREVSRGEQQQEEQKHPIAFHPMKVMIASVEAEMTDGVHRPRVGCSWRNGEVHDELT